MSHFTTERHAQRLPITHKAGTQRQEKLPGSSGHMKEISKQRKPDVLPCIGLSKVSYHSSICSSFGYSFLVVYFQKYTWDSIKYIILTKTSTKHPWDSTFTNEDDVVQKLNNLTGLQATGGKTCYFHYLANKKAYLGQLSVRN